MDQLNASVFKAGVVAYCVALFVIVGAGPLTYFAYRLNAKFTKEDDDLCLNAGNVSTAISLGSMAVCQAILIRHAVFAVMEVVRTLFIYQLTPSATFWLFVRCAVFFAFIVVTALISVPLAGRIFTRLTRKIREERKIREDNVAIAVFFALNLLAITLILDPGMQEFARSMIPFGRSGF